MDHQIQAEGKERGKDDEEGEWVRRGRKGEGTG